jgi:hypothetical protein
LNGDSLFDLSFSFFSAPIFLPAFLIKEAKKAKGVKRQKSGFLPFYPLRLFCFQSALFKTGAVALLAPVKIRAASDSLFLNRETTAVRRKTHHLPPLFERHPLAQFGAMFAAIYLPVFANDFFSINDLFGAKSAFVFDSFCHL